MIRTKAIALFLVMVLILAAAVAPVVVSQMQLGLAAYNARGSISLFPIEIGASTPAIAIACGGCSGGGSGPE